MGQINPSAHLNGDENRDTSLNYDAVIVGAGLSGIFSLLRMRQLGMRARVLEAGSGEGGTWYWNRYPGARFDSESSSMTHFQEGTNSWLLTDVDGATYSCKWLITAMGILNQPTLPDIPGVHDFKGEAWHTARWPSDSSALNGKRVGIIGTGATAIQTIQAIKDDFGSLTVFQRTPNWTAPLRNTKISQDEMQEIRKNYPDIFRKCQDSSACFVHVGGSGKVADKPIEERYAEWETLYEKPGFAKVLSVPPDIYTNHEANKLYSDFHARKIRARVNDPVTAERLIPKNHGFGTRRLPLESGYYEVFNQDNVKLVDLKETPVDTVTEKGIRTTEEEHELDIIIYATGFDAVTGSFSAVDIRGRGGKPLKEVWEDGLSTFLGLTVKDFPNMFMIMGPHQMFGNIPRSIEFAVEWVSDLIKWAREREISCIEATQKGMDDWTMHVHECGKGLLANEVDSWMTGVNKNLKHKQKRSMTRYNGPAPGYRKRCEEVKARDYSDFVMT
ncbi:hypothetical protein MBLNU230_g4813t1 [Neophaeotheca triangularis]